MKNKIYRLDLTEHEYNILHSMIAKVPTGNTSLVGKIASPKIITPKSNPEHAKHMAQRRWGGTQEKIMDAIKQMETSGKEITAASLARYADVHYNTAKKYLEAYLERKENIL